MLPTLPFNKAKNGIEVLFLTWANGEPTVFPYCDKDFKAKKAEENKNSDSSDESSGKFTDVSFEDI